MYRSAMLIFAVALASACGGRPQVVRARELDRRAERLVDRGHWDEARALLDRGLADARARGDRTGEARLLLRRGKARTDDARHRGGDRGPALADLEAAQAAARAAGDSLLLAATEDAIGMHRFTHWFSSQDPAELAAAEQQFRRALAIRAPRGDSSALAESTFHLGLIHQMRGELPAAGADFRRAHAIAMRVHDAQQASYAARHLGYLAELRHDGAAAEALYRESLELRAQAGPGPGVTAAQITLAELRYARDGDTARAVQLLTRAHGDAAAVGSAAYVTIASAAIARVERDAGHDAEAVRWLTAAIAAMDAIHSDEDVPEAYEQIALIELLRGDPAAARTAIERGLARRRSPRLEALAALIEARRPHAEPAARVPGADCAVAVVPAASRPVVGGRVVVAEPVASNPVVAARAVGAEPATSDPVVVARRALAAGDPTAALEAALRGDDPDTLLLAARAVGASAASRAIAAASAISHAQGRRFARELHNTPIALADAHAGFAEAAALCDADRPHAIAR